MESKFKEMYMRRAIELAKKGTGAVNPNPLVGAVIVKDGRVIGEGYHRRYGELHAERDAFAHLTEDAEGAEMYVTLEPCCHFGKQPPCTQAIVEHKIKKVYVGSDDPNELVAGKGIAYLRENGIEVETQVLKEECDRLNDIFFHYITTRTPYIMMKYAMTLDGKIATATGKSKWITGESSRHRVQESRNRYMGIMAGVNTVLTDDPQLTCRIEGGRNPVRIICDTNCRIPLDSNIVKTAKKVRTMLVVGACLNICDAAEVNNKNNETLIIDTNRGCGKNNDVESDKIRQKLELLKAAGVEILAIEKKDGHIDLEKLMHRLGEMGIDSILVEGGGTLNDSLLKTGLVNELNVYIAPKLFGGASAKTPVEGSGVDEVGDAHMFRLCSTEIIDEDVLLIYKTDKISH